MAKTCSSVHKCTICTTFVQAKTTMVGLKHTLGSVYLRLYLFYSRSCNPFCLSRPHLYTVLVPFFRASGMWHFSLRLSSFDFCLSRFVSQYMATLRQHSFFTGCRKLLFGTSICKRHKLHIEVPIHCVSCRIIKNIHLSLTIFSNVFSSLFKLLLYPVGKVSVWHPLAVAIIPLITLIILLYRAAIKWAVHSIDRRRWVIKFLESAWMISVWSHKLCSSGYNRLHVTASPKRHNKSSPNCALCGPYRSKVYPSCVSRGAKQDEGDSCHSIKRSTEDVSSLASSFYHTLIVVTFHARTVHSLL